MWVFTHHSQPPTKHSLCFIPWMLCCRLCQGSFSFLLRLLWSIAVCGHYAMLFHFHVFFFSSVSQELKLSHFVSFQWEDSWYDFSLLLSVMSCFMSCHVTHQSWGDFHMHLERMSTLLCGQSSLWVGNGGRCGYIVRAQGVFLLPKLFCILIELHIHTLEYTNNWWNRNSLGWTDGRGLYFGTGTTAPCLWLFYKFVIILKLKSWEKEKSVLYTCSRYCYMIVLDGR